MPDLLDPILAEFAAFVAANARDVRGFLSVHESRWIAKQTQHRSGDAGSHHVFDLPSLVANRHTERILHSIGASSEQVLYLVDLVLKYLIYAERANGGYYLTHPIRGKQSFEFLHRSEAPANGVLKTIPFRLGPSIALMARGRDEDWFTSMLHEARGHVRSEGFTELRSPGSVSRESLRELSAKLKLPANVRGYDRLERASSIATAGTGLVGSLVSSNMWPAVLGSAVTIATEVWTGHVPSRISQVSWLQWMFEWPVEKQASSSDK
ncbi:hypothetical protein JIG36_40085 [Actinoplanes sp. LDG1-06]|uniref:Uncharacterized protein n=1 Tax=Paractinoplanes ovalisporus TaxID=2810368 RepID=A0ABS2APE2_9ACTN|nr:hypothetical protein [Actinoplanes ovalisporus]